MAKFDQAFLFLYFQFMYITIHVHYWFLNSKHYLFSLCCIVHSNYIQDVWKKIRYFLENKKSIFLVLNSGCNGPFRMKKNLSYCRRKKEKFPWNFEIDLLKMLNFVEDMFEITISLENSTEILFLPQRTKMRWYT